MNALDAQLELVDLSAAPKKVERKPRKEKIEYTADDPDWDEDATYILEPGEALLLPNHYETWAPKPAPVSKDVAKRCEFVRLHYVHNVIHAYFRDPTTDNPEDNTVTMYAVPAKKAKV